MRDIYGRPVYPSPPDQQSRPPRGDQERERERSAPEQSEAADNREAEIRSWLSGLLSSLKKEDVILIALIFILLFEKEKEWELITALAVLLLADKIDWPERLEKLLKMK